MTLPIVRPWHPQLGLFSKAFSDALDSGQVTNNGPYVREFERRLSEVLGAPTIVFNNGQSALIAMLMAAGVKGHEVICPSFTFAGTPHAIRMAGGIPVFAEVEPGYLGLDPNDVARRITHRTKAILGVDPYGICCNYDGLQLVADNAGIAFLCDSAPAFGSTVNGKPTGANAEAQIFSFHATKPFSTMEGGALCSKNEGLIAAAKRIRNFGQDDTGDCPEVGFNGKMQEVNAIIGLHQLDMFDGRLLSRTASASRLRRELWGFPGLEIVRAPLGQDPVWTYQPIFVTPEFGKSRDAVYEGLRERGIMARKYYTACHQMETFFNPLMLEGLNLPVTERLASQVIALPVYDDFGDGEIEKIVKALKDIYHG